MGFYKKIRDALRNEVKDGFIKREGYISSEIKFSTINPKEEALGFIDGGNASIISLPEINVSKLRIAWGKDKFNIENYYLITKRHENKTISFLYNDYLEEIENFEVDDIETAPEIIRRVLEIRAIANFDSYVLLDGDLEFHNDIELNEFNKVKNTKVFGLSKSSNILLNNDVSLERYCMAKSKIKPFASIDILISKVPNHPAKISCVCLNESSKHAFRVDTPLNEDTMEYISILLPYSNDFIFPGYPYGLIKADEFARITNMEIEYERTKLLHKIGINVEEKSHKILDSIKF